jgi:hypothetical protein
VQHLRRSLLTIGIAIGLCLQFERPAAALPGAGIVSNAVGDATSNAFDSMIDGLVGWVVDSVQYFTGGVVNFLGSASTPGVDSVWFSGPSSPYASVRSVALTLLLGFFLLGTLTGLMHGDPSGMVRRMVGALPASIAGMVFAPQVAAYLLDLTDEMSSAVLANSGGDALHFLSTFGLAINASSGGFGMAVIAIIAILSALMLWIELLLRSALVYFLVALSPLAFAARVWPSAQGVLRRLTELLIGAIFSKLVICIALAVGMASLGNAGHAAGSDAGVGTAIAAGIGALVTGTTLLMLAAWSPFLLMRMMPIIETAVIAQGLSRAPLRAAASGVSLVSSVSSVARIAGTTNVSNVRASMGTQRLAGGGKAA